MEFESEYNGHKIISDGPESVGGENKASIPKPLLLAALNGCTGMDVVSILGKMKIEDYEFEMDINYEMSEDHPKTYTSMELVYKFKGNDLPLDKLEKAVKLSQEKYCGVASLIKKAIPLTYKVEVI